MISSEILLANGYRESIPPPGTSADTMYQKQIRTPIGHPQKGLLLYSINAYMFDFRNTSVDAIHFTFEVVFYGSGKEWYTISMNGAEVLALDQVERKFMNFYTRNRFVPDPYND